MSTNKLVEEFMRFIDNAYLMTDRGQERDKKIYHILERLQDATVRQLSQQVMEIDVDCSGWTNDMLGEKMLRHAYFRSRPDNILPAHCMMIEAGKRLKSISKHEPAPTGTLPPQDT